jgi:rhodanese-related sulfurtransferase
MAKTISTHELRQYWIENSEVALLDVREEGPYANAHPLFALSVPVSEIEWKVPSLVPRLSVLIVVYDNGEGYVERAVGRIAALGYRDVAILDGGLSAYARVGEVYRDVNVPSKAFGELVEAIRATPSLPAREVKNILDTEDNVVVLDVRRFEEYNTMSIPRGRSCPGGELVYRILDVAPSPDTTVLVNCAGRTRSILGTQSLINAGIPNRILAVRNGTIGWTLEGLALESKKTERVPEPSDEARSRARVYAESWAKHVGVSMIDGAELDRFRAEAAARTLYTLDVRDPGENALGHPAGFISAPGGQLVQATDEWVGVRGARIVLYDDDGVRARMTATWLLQLGWDVHVLNEQAVLSEIVPVPKIMHTKPSRTVSITLSGLQTLADATVVDLARSPIYCKGHIPGAWFGSGPELARDLKSAPGTGPIVLTCSDGLIASMNVEEARKAVSRDIFYLQDGTAAWKAANLPLETASRWLSEPIDVYKRPYEGTDNAREQMQGYIDWEHQLITQLANDGISGFHVTRDRTTLH